MASQSTDPQVQVRPDLLIIIMGPTGAGKSTFANRLLGQNVMVANGRLKSVTQTVEARPMDVASGLHAYANRLNCGRAMIVDTPGFDDSNRDDMEILRLIADWLINAYTRQDSIGVLLYLHDISIDRFSGSAAKNLMLFQSLIGEYSLSNVILGTTKSARAPPAELEDRIESLRDSYWASLIEAGATAVSLDPPVTEEPIMECMNKTSFRPILLQVELVFQQKDLTATAVGRAVKRRLLEGLISMRDTSASSRAKYKEMLKKLDKEDKKADVTPEMVDELLALRAFDKSGGKSKGNVLKRVTLKIAGAFSKGK